ILLCTHEESNISILAIHLLSALQALSSFSFTSCLAPLHLPSFPTRRSSDLPFSGRSPAPSRSRSRCWSCSHGSASWRSSSIAPRSEEHTSELQSRGHLVCRLLLEKKNNINSSILLRVKKKTSISSINSKNIT